MTEERVTPLRQRMIEDMRIRGMGDKAQKSHIRAIKDFAAFLGRSPDTATPEDLRAYQLHMTDTGIHLCQAMSHCAPLVQEQWRMPGSRSLPDRSARRACGRVHQMRPPSHQLQFLQEQALPEVPGASGARLDGSARPKDLLPVEYFHVVLTMPTEIAQITYWNKKAISGVLFKGEPMERQWSERHWRTPKR